MRSIPARLSTLARTPLLAGLLGASSSARALEVKPFSTAALASAQKAGQPVAVHFHAEWCPNCRKQSTLVVFKGATERARVAGETDSAKLAVALRSAL